MKEALEIYFQASISTCYKPLVGTLTASFFVTEGMRKKASWSRVGKLGTWCLEGEENSV